MKLSKLFVILATTTLLITGCSKKSKTGTKTTYDVFKQTVETLDTNHPYQYATINYSFSAVGQKESGKEECTYSDGEWHSEITGSGSQMWFITRYTAQDFVSFIYGEYIDLNKVDATFYTNPLSSKLKATDATEEGVITEDGTFTWDKYGLLTYLYVSDTVSGMTSVTEITITYRSKNSGGGSGGGSGQGKKEVTQSEFLNSFNDNHPYRRAHLSLSSTVGESAEIDYEYTDGSWVAHNTPYVSLNAMIAENYIPSMGALAEQGYEIHYYTNPYLFVMKLTESGSTVEMQIEYNQYGLPVNGVETYSYQGQSGRATFTVTYSF